MRTIEALLNSAAAYRVGWALLHSLWQSSAVALALAVLLRRLHRAPAEARYLAACAALIMMVALPAATSGILSPATGPADAAGSVAPARRPGAIGGEAGPFSTLGPRSLPHAVWRPLPGWPRALLPALAAAWTIGILVLSLRLLGGWLLLGRLGRRHILTPGDPAGEALVRLSRALRIRRGVRLLESSLVRVPMVIGGFRPVILLPLAAMTGLTPAQLEALLAHELAHIRRHDYLVNLAQCALEVLLFYHPAAWWASRVIRAEREHCCDDLAVRACGDRLTYARALAAMEGLRRAPYLSLAATGGPLLGRVRRILNQEVESMYRVPIVGPVAAVLIGSLLLAGANAQQAGSSAREASRPGAEGRASSVRDSPLVTIHVPLFRSVSFRRGVQLQLTELVIKEIEKRTRCKVVGNVEEADMILEGTINFADKNMIVEDPFNLPRQLTAAIQASVNWTHSPPLDYEKDRAPTLVSETVNFATELGESSLDAFYRANQNLAARIVDAMERRAPRERQAHPAKPSSDPASGRGRGPGADAGALALVDASGHAMARGRSGVPSSLQDPPSEEEIWKRIPKFGGGEVQRNNVRFGIEKIGEKVEPCKVDLLVGPSQRVHRHYKCTVWFDERRRPAEPASSGKLAVHRVEVIYLDRDYLRRCPHSPATP